MIRASWLVGRHLRTLWLRLPEQVLHGCHVGHGGGAPGGGGLSTLRAVQRPGEAVRRAAGASWVSFSRLTTLVWVKRQFRCDTPGCRASFTESTVQVPARAVDEAVGGDDRAGGADSQRGRASGGVVDGVAGHSHQSGQGAGGGCPGVC